MHCYSDEEMTERASLYALGALSLWEARAFEEHLSEGCELCSAELQSFEEVTDALGRLAPEQDAPAHLREQLQALVAKDAPSSPEPLRAATAAPTPLMTLRAGEGEWREIAKGMQVKELFVDSQNGTVTTLVRMQPGASIPSHEHSGIEQCYVIEGDFHAASQSLGPGDFHCAQPGSVHEPVYTVGGALVLIVAPVGYHALERH